MNFDYNEEQQLLAASVRRFVDKQYDFDTRRKIVASSDGYSDSDLVDASPRSACSACRLPADFGGFGGGAVDLMSVMEAFGEALVVEPYLSTVAWARSSSRAPARTAQEAGAAAAGRRRQAQDGVRADRKRRALRPRARRDACAQGSGDGYVLDGEKCVVLHAPCARTS